MTGAAPFDRPGVHGFLHQPAQGGKGGLVLTHGAGGDCRSRLLERAAEAFAAAGLDVLRCDLPFRQRRPKGAPSPSAAAADRDGLKQALAALRAVASGPLYLGGQSYGGRQASVLAAEEPEIAAGLVLLSYPLHPPGRPRQLRTGHFPRLVQPVVFVQGTRDPFATIDELRAAAAAAIRSPVQILPVDGAGHDLRRGQFDFAPVIAALLGPSG